MAPLIRPILNTDIESYHRCLDDVCREGFYLAFLQAPPFEKSRAYVLTQLDERHPMFVAVRATKLPDGWTSLLRREKPRAIVAGSGLESTDSIAGKGSVENSCAPP